MTPWQESRLRILEQRLGESKRKIREQQISIFSLEQMALMMAQMHGTGDGPAGPASVVCTPCNIPRMDQTLTIDYEIMPFGSTNTVALAMTYEPTGYSMTVGNATVGGDATFTVPNPHWTSPCHVFSDSIFNPTFVGSQFSTYYWRFLFGCFGNQVALAAVFFDPSHDGTGSYESASSRCSNYPSSTAQFHRPDGGVLAAFGVPSTRNAAFTRDSMTCSPFQANYSFGGDVGSVPVVTPCALFSGGAVLKCWWNTLIETIP
jgi:hypothetical protein